MAGLTLEQLINITNFPDDFKQVAIAKLPHLSEDQKFDLAQVCWEHLATTTQAKVQAKKEEMFEQLANGQITTPPSLPEIETQVLNDLLNTIEFHKSQEEVKEIKEELAKYTSI